MVTDLKGVNLSTHLKSVKTSKPVVWVSRLRAILRVEGMEKPLISSDVLSSTEARVGLKKFSRLSGVTTI